jgi:hypothetical protein
VLLYVITYLARLGILSRQKKNDCFSRATNLVKFCVKIGKSVTETFEMLKIAFGEEAMCRTQTYEWWKRFKEAELRLMMIRVRDGHQRRKLTIML